MLKCHDVASYYGLRFKKLALVPGLASAQAPHRAKPSDSRPCLQGAELFHWRNKKQITTNSNFSLSSIATLYQINHQNTEGHWRVDGIQSFLPSISPGASFRYPVIDRRLMADAEKEAKGLNNSRTGMDLRKYSWPSRGLKQSPSATLWSSRRVRTTD